MSLSFRKTLHTSPLSDICCEEKHFSQFVVCLSIFMVFSDEQIFLVLMIFGDTIYCNFFLLLLFVRLVSTPSNEDIHAFH